MPWDLWETLGLPLFYRCLTEYLSLSRSFLLSHSFCPHFYLTGKNDLYRGLLPSVNHSPGTVAVTTLGSKSCALLKSTRGLARAASACQQHHPCVLTFIVSRGLRQEEGQRMGILQHGQGKVLEDSASGCCWLPLQGGLRFWGGSVWSC